ncbi:MAG: hypothetical protein WC989_07135 [Micavibrio sp.]
MKSDTRQTIHPFFWLVIPVLMIVFQAGFELFLPHEKLQEMHTEGGLIEILQSVVLLVAFGFAVLGAVRIDWTHKKLIGAWFLLAVFCTFYVSGEEISWGQHILYWDTPEYWAQVNDQNETNLHNTSSWFDQKPRLVLFIGIVFGGLVVPALRRWKPSALPQKFAVLYPADCLAVAALGVLLPYLAQGAGRVFFNIHLFERVSEVQELYMYYFVTLYLYDLYKREIL